MTGGEKRRVATLQRLANLRQREAEHLSVELQSMRSLRENAERTQGAWQTAVQRSQNDLLAMTEAKRTLDVDAFLRQRAYLAECRQSLASATAELDVARGHEERIADKIRERRTESRAMEVVAEHQDRRLAAAERRREMARRDDEFLMKLVGAQESKP